MDYNSQASIAQARPGTHNPIISAITKVLQKDPGLLIQLFFIIPVISGGVILGLSPLQWVGVIVATLIFVFAGICRTAANMQLAAENEEHSNKGDRIRSMGNALIAMTGGLALFTYLLIFIPHMTLL